jgi:hypothetical protein
MVPAYNPGMRSLVLTGAAGLLCAASALAQTPAAASSPSGGEPRGGEPNVRRTVIEDDANRIEELNVRGQTRSVVVTTKGPLASTYEIGTGDPSREASAAADPRRGTIGQRMWRLFSF